MGARAMQVHGADYARAANQLTTAFAVIETAQAIENLDTFLAEARDVRPSLTRGQH